jgi:hypothetical protein
MLSDYDQAKELYTRVFTEEQRQHLHSNTANMLQFVKHKVIKVGYLAQLWNIDPSYAMSIFELLPESSISGEEGFEFSDVQSKAKGAETAGKDSKFRPSRVEERLVGFSPEIGIYNVWIASIQVNFHQYIQSWYITISTGTLNQFHSIQQIAPTISPAPISVCTRIPALEDVVAAAMFSVVLAVDVPVDVPLNAAVDVGSSSVELDWKFGFAQLLLTSSQIHPIAQHPPVVHRYLLTC